MSTHQSRSLKLRQPGSGMYFCVHKYFYQRSEHWKDIREEESRAEGKGKTNRDKSEEGDEESIDIRGPISPMHFTPLDSRHLSSMSIIRSRLVNLLEGCTNRMHAAQNIIKTLVCSLDN